MKRTILKSWLTALAIVGSLTSCGWMSEDLDDCPTGLYVNFVYDYNIQQADMFKDHVGSVALYVYDESDRLVATKTMGDGQLSGYGSYIHFSEEELAPDHVYRLLAVAMQKDYQQALATPGAKYRISGNAIGDQRPQFFINLDHTATRAASDYYTVSNAAPLDTLWHTLTTVTTPASAHPLELHPAAITPARVEYSWQRDGSINTNGQETVTLERGVPTYATMSLIRDTKHLNVTLRALNDDPADNQVVDTDYTVEIIDNNAQLDCQNNLTNAADTLVYSPYHQWTTTFVGTDQIASEQAAHYDLMFNRLLYKNASVQDDRYAILKEEDIAKAQNAVLLIRKADSGEIIFGINLPYILASGRTYQERYYHYQEYLDREYDYRLQFILRGGRIEEIELFIGMDVHIIPWAIRHQSEVIE